VAAEIPGRRLSLQSFHRKKRANAQNATRSKKFRKINKQNKLT